MERIHIVKEYKNTFTRRLTGDQGALGFLVMLSGFLICNSIIISAVLKSFLLITNMSVTYSELNLSLNLLTDLLMLIIAFFCLKDFIIRQYHDFKERKAKIIFNGVVKGYALCFVMSMVTSIIVRLLTMKTTSANQQAIVSLSKFNPVVMLLMTVIFAPIGEELLFRGFLFTFFRKRSRFLAYFVSAFLFGFVHVMNSVMGGDLSEFIQMIPYFGMGLVFAYSYESNNNIFASILTHATSNAIAMITIFFI